MKLGKYYPVYDGFLGHCDFTDMEIYDAAFYAGKIPDTCMPYKFMTVQEFRAAYRRDEVTPHCHAWGEYSTKEERAINAAIMDNF